MDVASPPPQPHVRFEVEKVIGVSSAGNVRSYQVQWAPAWVSGFHLVGCEHLINEFLTQQHLGKENDTAVEEVNSASGSVSAQQSHNIQQGFFSDSSVSLASSTEQHNMELCTERGDEVDTDDDEEKNVKHAGDHGSDTAELTSAGGTDNDPETVVVKEPDLRSRAYDVDIKEEDGVKMCSNERGKPEVYKHINRVNSPESFRLNNISYLMQKTNKDGANLGDTRQPDELLPCSSNYSQSFKQQEHHQHQQQHHQSQRFPHSQQQLQRTSMVSFRSHHKPQHLVQDTKEKAKPYVCEHCDRGFSQRHHLKEHMRTHTGVKPFSCGVCAKTFSQRGTLNRHIQTHVKAAMLD